MMLFGKNLDHEVAVIAEIGVNHEGSEETAHTLLRLAAAAGADAVKFQSYTPERYLNAAVDGERLARIRRFALDEPAHRRLAALADELGVVFLSTPVSEDWLPLLAELGPAIKISSGDLTFEPVIRGAARTGKPVILSVGLGSVEEIDRAVEWVRDEVGAALLPERLALLHCVVSYPTPEAEANLLSIPFLSQRYGVPVGWSNHVIGPDACHTAVALGARILEVHFTDCKAGRSFRDHALSFEPDDLRALVARVAAIKASLGVADKVRSPCEQPNLKGFRKGIVAARDLAAGSKLSPADIMFARPADGFPASDHDAVVGRILARGIQAGHPLTPEDLAAS
jgi:N,N'-diacetyllegionaminate synthase